MSRSGYSDDCENLGLWRGAVERAISGKRGQALLIALRDALDAMPVKELAADSFKSVEGSYCTLGVLGANRGIDLSAMENAADNWEFDMIGDAYGSAKSLVQEIMFENDEGSYRLDETPKQRWTRMRAWLDKHIAAPTPADKDGV